MALPTKRSYTDGLYSLLAIDSALSHSDGLDNRPSLSRLVASTLARMAIRIQCDWCQRPNPRPSWVSGHAPNLIDNRGYTPPWAGDWLDNLGEALAIADCLRRRTGGRARVVSCSAGR